MLGITLPTQYMSIIMSCNDAKMQEMTALWYQNCDIGDSKVHPEMSKLMKLERVGFDALMCWSTIQDAGYSDF
jgi:hypothetical protein